MYKNIADTRCMGFSTCAQTSAYTHICKSEREREREREAKTHKNASKESTFFMHLNVYEYTCEQREGRHVPAA